jgi:HAD superfamily hydrolase (TIGR01549 family)
LRTPPIKHVWFDFSDTIASNNAAVHDQLKYESYAQVLGRPVDEQLKHEFDLAYEAHHHSNSDIFYSLGKPAGWWAEQMARQDPATLFQLTEADIPEMLQAIKRHVPISIFSNITLDQALPALGIQPDWFDHILSSGMAGKPKPALDGFRKIVELSRLQPDEILYVGDVVGKDILPAKAVGLQAGIIYAKSEEADYSFDSFRDIVELVAGHD